MSDYRKYLLRQMGLKEAQFVPFVREDEHPDIDPEVLMRKKKKEMGEHPHLSAHDAELVAKQHMKKGVDEQGPMVSPTAIATPIIAVGIRGSYTGGLPSGADKGQGPDLAPNKLGGYDRVQPEMLNSKLIDKTPKNPEIGQEAQPIVNNPSTENGVTHPHQIQVTAGEEPQATTGASTDSDPTLKLKSGMPKGIDIDITEKATEPTKEEENPMIPATSLSEVFEKHKRLMYEKIGACSCGHMKKECDCKPDCKCGCNKKVEECSTCGCGDPSDTHGEKKPESKPEPKKPTVAKKKYFDPKTKTLKDVDWISMKEGVPAPGSEEHDQHYAIQKFLDSPQGKLSRELHKQTVEPVAAAMMRQMQGEKPKYIPPSGGAGLNEADKKARVCYHCKQPHPCPCDKKDQEDAKFARDNPEEYRKKFQVKVDRKDYVNESYSSAFERMRGLAGIGTHQVLGKNGLWESKEEKEDLSGKCCECGKDLDNDSDTCNKCKAKLRPDRLSQFTEGHAAGENFNTHWKMDKEKAGFVKIDEAKLNHIKAQLEKKSKRGTLSDKELLLTKRIAEALKKRNQSQEVDKNIGKMQKDPNYRPAPFDKDHTGPMRHGNDKGQLPAK